MAVKKITDTEIQNLEKSTAKNLPDNPTKAGYSPEQIKKRLYKGFALLAALVNMSLEDIDLKLDDIDSEEIQIGGDEPTDPKIKIWVKEINQ